MRYRPVECPMTADDELAHEAAELFTAADPTGSKAIRQLAELVARRVPACSGAGAALWRAGEMVTMAASDPDVAALTSFQIETRRGPLIETLRTKESEGCADTLTDDRWQEFAAAALSKGVRCCACLMHEFNDMVVSLALYSVRPRSGRPESPTRPGTATLSGRLRSSKGPSRPAPW